MNAMTIEVQIHIRRDKMSVQDKCNHYEKNVYYQQLKKIDILGKF